MAHREDRELFKAFMAILPRRAPLDRVLWQLSRSGNWRHLAGDLVEQYRHVERLDETGRVH